jgi:MFS-type transporter involved in bile tolerance (Atg22 family)
MAFLKAFIAGFVSTLVFHQGVLTLLHLAGAFPRAPYDLGAVPPLGIPAVISLAFWGGVWGAAIWPLLKNAAGAAYWLRALVIGAIGPSAVALFIVFPLKGMPMAGGWDPKLVIGALVLNGAWGLGLALLMRLMTSARTTL